MERDRTADPESTMLDEAGRSLFRLGRAFGRLPLRELLAARGERDTELSAILVAQAVEAGELVGGAVTIGDVAARLGVDPSTASRLVAQAVETGYLHRAGVPGDRRATALTLTETGQTLAGDAARYQRAVFEAATADWSDAERQAFARHFVRFAEAIMAELGPHPRATNLPV